MSMTRLALVLLGLVVAEVCTVNTSPLYIDVYNPPSIFNVSSEILVTDKEVVLFDAQFQKNHAEELVQRILDTHLPLTRIYISQGDPDFYFGLDVIQESFPNAQILATNATVDLIANTYELKEQVWGPQLGVNKPSRIVIPKPLDVDDCGYAFSVGDHSVYIRGRVENRTYAWIPSSGTILGGALIVANAHPFIADTKTEELRDLWIQTLDDIIALCPEDVIPGHFSLNPDGSSPRTLSETVEFTRDYLVTFNEEDARTSNSTELIAAIAQRYPTLSDLASLETSARVVKGEMAWP